MRRHAGTLILFVLLLAIGGIVAWRAVVHVRGAPAGSAADLAPARIAVEVAPVESGVVRDIRLLSGTLEASTRFDVAAKVGGLIERIAVDIGDEVQRGQTVAQIDDDEFVQAVAQSEAELAVRKAEQAQATSELTRVQRDFDRISGLRERGVVSDFEYDEISATLESQQAALALAEARVRQAEATLKLARIRLGYATVRANWEGGPDFATIGERFKDTGDTVQAGAPLVSVVALDPLLAVVTITERDYTRLRIGQEADLQTDALPGASFAAQIVRIAPIFRESSRQARVELSVPNPQRTLKPGLFVRVRIQLEERSADAIVPLAAVTRRDGEDVVFRLADEGDTVELVPVTVGLVDGQRVEIRSPALRGRVVVLGQQLLTDGTPVTIHEPSVEPAAPAVSVAE